MVHLGPTAAARMQRSASQTEPDPEVEARGSDDGNPFRSSDWRVWSYAWAGFAVRLLIVVGGVFSVLQYLDTREENRVERTLQLVELWEEPEFQAAQRAVVTRLDALNAQFAELLDKNATEQERLVYFDRLGAAALQTSGGAMPLDEFREHFDRLLYFLNRLAYCVDGNLCSKEVADSFFGDFAKSFWAYFGGHLREQRSGLSANYAAPLEQYVKGLD
ncbi:MAG: hypothetical protein JJ913_08545 [Rhizobiaceae bacterium]|nr:hypothetical protein [Rhizobiaceae bacterium]